MSRSKLLGIVTNVLNGAVYAVVYDREIERLDRTTIHEINGRAGMVLSWVPVEFKP